MEDSETTFDAEQNEIEYEDAMTEQAATVERLAAELAAANAEIAGQNMTIKTLSEHIANNITDDLTFENPHFYANNAVGSVSFGG